jgi:hypothetical protein
LAPSAGRQAGNALLGLHCGNSGAQRVQRLTPKHSGRHLRSLLLLLQRRRRRRRQGAGRWRGGQRRRPERRALPLGPNAQSERRRRACWSRLWGARARAPFVHRRAGHCGQGASMLEAVQARAGVRAAQRGSTFVLFFGCKMARRPGNGTSREFP